jgi:thiol-disulfide isomerase/thioredoxin
MNKTFTKIVGALVALIAGMTPAQSKEATLHVGDAAPALKASKWVKGDPIDKLDPNQTYVVEFWATWCGPCRTSIPHLTELAHKYKDKVIFIGMDASEMGNDVAAKEKTVAKFVQGMADKMDYNVAIDAKDGFMSKEWMEAAGQNGIPAAFVVNQGKIVWIGHPMSGLEETLDQVLSGKFDVDKARKLADAQGKVQAFSQKAMKGGNEAELQAEGKELETLDKELGGILPEGKRFSTAEVIKQVKFVSAMQAYQQAVFAGKEAAEIEKLETAAKAVAPAEVDFEEIKAELQKYVSLAQSAKKARDLFGQYVKTVSAYGDKAKAAELAQQLGELNLKEPQSLNEMAWTILTDEKIKQRDLSLATKLAKAALDASAGKNAGILDTYARALFDSGKGAEAIEYQQKAVAACDDDSTKSELQTTLKIYQAAADKAVEKKQ